MKTQQGAPEALRPIARYKIGYHTDDWGMRSSTPSGIQDHAGAWVRYEDHVAALVEAQQPATHVQNPAEIEHVAGDVSKNSAESNMAQQAAPSAAAASNDRVPEAWTNVLDYVLQDDLHNRLTPRVIDIAYTAFMQAKRPNDEDGGASDWFNDTRPMVRELIAKLRRDLIEELAGAPQPSPTPQADSQPAPVRGYLPLPRGWPARFRCDSCDGNGEVGEPISMGHFQPPERARCPDCDGRGWCSEEDAFSADHMRAYVDADRAARAPADSVTAPAGGAVAGPGWQMVPVKPTPEMLRAGDQKTWVLPALDCWRAMLAAAPNPPAQAADSVLEDADPLQGAANWLAEAHGQFCVAVLQGCLMIGYNRAKRLHDAAIAARKQGANLD